MPWILLILILALICFLVPVARSIRSGAFAYTDAGLALITLVMILGETAV